MSRLAFLAFALISCTQGLSSSSLLESNAGRPLGLWNKLHLQEQEAHDVTVEAQYPAHTLKVPINHFPTDSYYAPHQEGSFALRYWVDTKHYRHNGPIFVLDGGETSGHGRLPFLDHGILSILSQSTHGLSVVLEHRYYGDSFPTQNLSTDNLRFLSTEQSILDIKYWVENVQIPGIGRLNSSNPVILYGGSYAGAKVAFARKLHPETFFGAIASSGVIHAQENYWNYFDTIRQYGPPDCINAVINTVQLVDSALALRTPFVTRAVKNFFGLPGISDDKDFVNVLTMPLDSWQGRNWDPSLGDTSFFSFCSNLTASSNSTETFSLSKPATWSGAIGYANYIKQNIANQCPPEEQEECFGTSNSTQYQSVALDQTWRSWIYQVCTEWGYFQVAAPQGTPSLLSRLLDVEYASKICRQAFPPGIHNRVPTSPNVTRVNQIGDFDLTATRIAFIDGEEDPWIGACAHSDLAKHRYRRVDTVETPYKLIKGGVHHWDENGLINPEDEPREIAQIHAQEIEFVKHWLEHFEPSSSSGAVPQLVLQKGGV